MSCNIQDLKKIKNGGGFKNYIDYIRFPFFKNISPNAKIEFDFPFTVLIGKNGSGKSSVLHALYGAPKNQSVSNFWFSTNIDPIKESPEGDRHCFIYAYTKDGKSLEVLKTRIKNKGNPDYWEPSRPVQKYGMEMPTGTQKGKRNDPITMNVIYRNFRSTLSSFDKYFYHNNNPQSYLRNKARSLKKALAEDIVIKGAYNHDQNQKRHTLTASELKVISDILGKEYSAGTIIHHKFFKEWGYSILFSTQDLQYSEAFAGSGELSAAMLVYEVLNAPKNSLILLDEPEISLHPGAQTRLRQFLFEQIKLHKHQVIISTHSPAFVDGLPSSAIKVFSTTPSGKYSVIPERLPEEAFYEIGSPSGAIKTVYTEDRLGADIVKTIVADMGDATSSIFGIKHVPGGVSAAYDHAAKQVALGADQYIWFILDGDQQVEFEDPDLIPVGQKNATDLEQKIIDKLGTLPRFYLDGNNETLKIDTYFRFLQFLHRKVKFLPAATPESIIWSEAVARQLLTLLGEPQQVIDHTITELAAITDYKTKFVNLTEKVKAADGQTIAVIHSAFIKNWKNSGSPTKTKLTTMLSQIRDTQN